MLFDLLGAEATAATSYWTGSNSSQNPAARRPPASGADPAMAHDTSGDHGVSLVENRGLRTPSRGLMERLFRRGATSPSATAAGPGDVSGAPQQPATSAITVGLGIDIQGELDAWFETNLEPAEDASKTFLAGRLDCEPSPIEPCFNIPPMATGPLGGDLSGLGDETRTAGATLAARSVEAAPYLPSWAAAEPPSAGEAEHSPSPSGSPSASPSGSPSEAAPAAQVAPADAASTARRQTVRASIGSTARLGFEQGLDGWTASQSGGSLDGMGAVTSGSAVLREGDSFLVTLQQDFTVPDQPLSISFVYTASFDTTDPDFINDAFEVALTDADGYSLVDTFDAQRDAFFNLTEDLPVALGAKTTQTTVSQGNEVTLDISDVPPGIEATLTFRLVNNDSDTESTVTILSVDIASMARPPSVTIGLLNDTAPAGPGSEPYRTDLLTNDPTVTGTATDDEAVVQLEAQVNDGPFVDITSALTGDTYTFDPGPLPPGPHRITVRATDQQGNAGSSSLDFRVNTPPVANAGPDRTVDEGSQVTFDASASSDAEAALFAYLWTFPDGSTSAGPSASRPYPQDGTFAATLSVTDTAGSIVTDTVQVVVINLPPTVLTAWDLSGMEGANLDFVATFSDAGVLDTHTAVVHWSDGSTTAGVVSEAGGQGTVTAGHVYADNGVYPIRVDVTDNGGATGSRQATATIANVPPSVTAAAPQTVEEGSPLQLTVATFTDPGFTSLAAGTQETFTATINWGDGTLVVPGQVSATSGAVGTPTSGSVVGGHTYQDDGTYTVTVTVRDDDGGTGTASFTVTVNNAVPTVLTATDLSGMEGANLDFVATFSDAGVLDTHTAIVHWSDGSTTAGVVSEAGGQGTVTASHVYADNGAYPLRVDVTDNGGATGRRQAMASIANVPPSVTAAAPQTVEEGSPLQLTVATFTDPGFTSVAAGTQETFTATIDWGDGSLVVPGQVSATSGAFGTPTSGSVVGGHTYQDDGTYTVTVTVMDDDGGHGTATFLVTVTDVRPALTSSISGYVYLDVNDNGVKDPPEQPLPNVPIALTGPVSRTTVTAADGSYRFEDLPQGTYAISETQPLAFDDGRETQGMPRLGLVGDDRFYAIELATDVHATGYNFGECGLRAELITKQLLLASTPSAGQLVSRMMVADESWFTFRAGADGLLTATVPVTVRSPVIEVYSGDLRPVALSHGRSAVSATVTNGVAYLVHVAGANGSAFETSLQLDASTPETPTPPPQPAFPLTTNPRNHQDVNADGLVTPLDVLAIVNALNRLPLAPASDGLYLDVNGDGLLTPNDALQIVNYLNFQDRPNPVSQQLAGSSLRAFDTAETPSVREITAAAIAPPVVVVKSPQDDAEFLNGGSVVIAGVALATTEVGPLNTPVANRIVAVLINDSAVDVLDAGGNFFAQVDVLPGENVFDLTAIDAYGQMAATRVTVIGSQASTGHVDLLFDVSPSFAPLYARTSFEPRSSQLFAELAIHNVGQYPADNPFYVGVRNISDPTVSVREAVGRTRDGIPYYDFSKVIPGNSLNPDDVTGFVHAVFQNPNRVQFTYELVFLAKLNGPPMFTTVPEVETQVGFPYHYDADAADPDGDTLIYDLLVGPSSMSVGEATGQLTWLPTLADLGVHAVVINVTDGRGGSAEQRYLLSVTESLPNRPPVITSLPVVEAVVNAGYRYDVVAVDADSDTLNYKLLASDFTGYRQTVLDDQPVGYWRLERTTLKTAVDETGQGFDGRYENAPSFQSGAIAQTSDAAVQFNGIDQHITIPDSGRLTPQRLTVEAWVNPSAFGNNGKVLMKGASYELSISSTTPGRIFFFVNGSNTKVDAPLNVGEWSHVVGTFDSTTLRLYVNGMLVSTKPYSASVKYSSQPLVIGAGGGRRSYWNGALDEIAIYERVLSAQEVLRHYRKGINGPSKMSPPAGMTINPATGVITWLPTETQVGQHEVVVEVSDGHGGLDQQAFVVRVEPEPGNRPPVFVSAPTTNVYLVPLSQLTNTITFESIPGDVPRTGLPISTQFWDSHGISFGFEGSGESLLLADVGPPRTAFVGYQGRADEPAPGQDVGTYFLTDDDQVGAPPPPIIITYAEPVSSAGAVIIDIDQDYEEWTIEARDIAGNVLDTIVLDPYSYPSCGRVTECGLAVPWHFLRESADISSIRITYTGTSAGVGLAFDNFTTSRAGQEYSYDADAIDPDGDSLEYTLEEGPVGMLVDPTTGLLRWPLDARQVGEHAVRVRVSDGRGGFDVQAFSLTVRGQGTSEIRGTVFHDVNGDGDWMPPEEPGLEGWTVYLDANGDGRHDLGERSTVTHDDGTYAFGALPQGTYVVRQVPQPAWQQTEPLTRSYTVTLAADETVTGFDFGNVEQSAENRSPLFTSKPPDSADVDELTRYNAAAVDPDNDPLTFDLPLAPGGMTVHPQRGIVVWQPTRDQVGTHQVVVRVSDGRGGVALQPFEIIVVPPNSPPIITSTPPSPAVVDLPLQYPVRAQDADGDSLVFRTENAPAGVQINPQTGLLTWTPTSGQLGQHTFTVAVSDGRGGEARQAVAIDVVADAPNDPPVITSQPRLRARVGSPYGYLIEAHDPNGDPLTYHLDAAPAGMTVDDLGVVRWQPSAELRGTQQPVTVRVDDGRVGGVATQEFVLEVVSQDSNQAPWITSTPVLTGVSGRTYQYQLTARDPDGDPVMWSLDVAPAGMSIDPLRGTLRWTPAADQTGSHPVVVRVQDIFFAAGTQSFAVNVRATNQPPSIRSTPDVTASPDELYVYAVRAVDPDGDPLTFRGAVMPSGMTLDARSGLIQWTPTAADVGPHAVRVVVEDGQGGIDSQAYTLHVGHQPLNHPPVITSTPVYFATSERLYQYPVTAQDPDGGSIVFSLERNPAGMEIDAGTGVITWTPTAGSPADPTVTVVATDEAGARATQTYILTVRANQPPRIVAPPARSIAVGASYRYDVRATDPERDAITFELVAPPAGMSIDPQGRIAWQPTAADVRAHTIQIVARDSYGATDTASYALTVTADTEAPRVTLSASTPRVDWHGEVIFDVRATDNVGVELLSLSLGGTEVPLVFQNGLGRATVAMDTIGVFQAVATATDAAGNVGGSNIVDVTVRDPKDVQFPQVAINALEQSGQRIEGDDLYSVPTLTYLTDIIATINDTDLSAWWVDYARADLVNLNNVADSDPDYVRLAEGTGPVFAGVVGTLDPSLLANDSYVIRVSGMDLNGQISSEAILVAVSGQAKLGNFRFALTDLQIPLAGIPITITRIYDTLHAGEEGDFGYGWSLGIQDAKIRETVPANGEFIPGKTRVYLTTPDGRRVGFTYKEAQVPIWDLPGVGVIWQGFLGDKRYRMYFEPDPGVTEKLSIDQEFIERGGLSGAFYQLGSVLGGGVAIVNPNTYTLTTRDGLQYRYDQTAGLQYIRDLNGNTVTFSSTEIRHSTGGAIRLVRDARGRIMRIIDTADNSISYRYDARGDLVGVTNQIGETTRYVYRTDPAHFLEEVYDSANVRVFRAEFDDDGRLTSSVDALGGRVQQDFDLEAMTGTITDARGNVTTLWYDEQGNITQEQSAPVLNPITGETVTYSKTYEYTDPRHPDKETKIVEYDGTIVEYQYDAAGNTIKNTRTSADGSQAVSTEYAYDAKNNLTKLTTPGGGTSTFGYTDNNLTSVVSAAGQLAYATYTTDGKQDTFTDFNGNMTAYVHTAGCAACNVPARVTHPDGSYELRQTNRQGLVTREDYYEADGTLVYVRTTAYDSLGRKIRDTVGMGADQVVTSHVYQGSTENITRQTVVHPTDPSENRVTHYFYDAAGNLIRQVDPDLDAADRAAGIFFKYDASGNRVWLMDPVGNVTTWIYDALGRVIEERDPLYWEGTDWTSMNDAQILTLISTPTAVQAAPYGPSHITRYAYDGADNLIEQIDRNGRRRTFEYDHRGNMLAEVWYDQADDVTPIREMVFSYDTAGNMLTATDPDAEYVFTYDEMKRLKTMSVDYPWATNFDTFTLAYEYDAMGNVISTTDSTGVAVKSTYDSRNQLASRWWDGDEVDNIRVDFGYTAARQLAHIARWVDKDRTTSVGTTDYAYDLAGRVRQITHKNAVDDVIANYDYEFDFSGLLTKETLTHINAAYNRTADYGYDQRGQLISAEYDNDQEDEWYAYDANGNRTGTYLHGNGYRTGSGNQLLSDGTFNYTYDHEGNMVTKTRITPVEGEVNYTEYDYDFRNRMTRVTQYSRHPSEGGIVLHEECYRYDALGRRIRVVSDGIETIFVYDGPSFTANECGRFDASGKVVQRFLFTYNVDQLIAQSTEDEGVAWTLTDHLGSIRDVVNNAGQVVQHTSYSAFGAPAFTMSGDNMNPYAFTGRTWGSKSRLLFYRTRNYDPFLGAFNSTDPMGFEAGDMRLYRYVYNSPINGTDPTGRVGMVTLTMVKGAILGTVAGAILGTRMEPIACAGVPEDIRRAATVLVQIVEGAVVGAGLGALIGGVLLLPGLASLARISASGQYLIGPRRGFAAAVGAVLLGFAYYGESPLPSWEELTCRGLKAGLGIQ